MMKKWWYKGCPKCGGDVYMAEDLDGFEFKCLQCGKTVNKADIRTPEYVSNQPVTAEGNARRAA